MARRYAPQRALTPANPASGSQVIIINNPLGFSSITTVVWGIRLPITGGTPKDNAKVWLGEIRQQRVVCGQAPQIVHWLHGNDAGQATKDRLERRQEHEMPPNFREEKRCCAQCSKSEAHANCTLYITTLTISQRPFPKEKRS